MKFTISSTSWWEDDIDNPILDTLRAKGYIIETQNRTFTNDNGTWEIPEPVVNISTLEELIKLTKDCGYEIVFTGSHIEIYDSYRE
jgi:hypothetical protein